MSDMPHKQDVQRSFRLPSDLDAKLVAKAAKLDRSVSWVIVSSLEAALLGEQHAVGRAVMRGTRKTAK